ncbi:CD3072 family TudS-related putative desulfidase [Clostridium botulinum]|uniref:DUF523 domain-containing protein n=1 Tax=Clostridium botulinum TaxID=1491 RepID=A0A6G4EGP9_CLOBO|nr:CD3072 family TudS-related putative desulfidase [Clostridium botulinum]APH18907.1 hypothetical protein NPD3_271 [Clostridium botulinum]AUM91109.1 hypothetical protein RSJ5_07425 [Clostridium botulinum]NFB13675.1 DUF523 domain-containing protein [Clostridium botulinum]NFH60060.1 DUF523 domain-containing protein [Clostridium botulinum]NFH62421.1 DUF523 domain-containing protein [Clostridium botulinum]
MRRSKKIVLISHCILNVNSKVEGLAQYENNSLELVKYLIENKFGIIQLPCPEAGFYGMRRWGHVKEQFDTPYYREYSQKIFYHILQQVEDYINNGYEIKCIIGIDGSPSCGVSLTCSSKEWKGDFINKDETLKKIDDIKYCNEKGIFMEEIDNILKEKDINIPMISINEATKTSLEKIKKFL